MRLYYKILFLTIKKLILATLLEIKNRMLNYMSLIYTLFIYLFKLSIYRSLILFKKIVPINIKFKAKKIIFSNSKFWKLTVFFNNWLKTPPSINKVRQINYIIFNLISIFFIPLFSLIIKKEKWEILMLEKLKNNSELKRKFNKFIINNKISKNETVFLQINKNDLSRIEIDILENFSKALFLKENNRI